MESDKKILRAVQHQPGDGSPDYMFWCPACHCGHGVWLSGPNRKTGASWSFNGNHERPTFQPSLKITGRDFTAKGWEQYHEWCRSGHPSPAPEFDCMDTCCHSVVTDGVIHYCADSTHALAGHAVPMEAF